jgi:hypothetical protein
MLIIQQENEEIEKNNKVEEVKDLNLINTELDNESNKNAIQIDRTTVEYNQYKTDSETVKKLLESQKIEKDLAIKTLEQKLSELDYL